MTEAFLIVGVLISILLILGYLWRRRNFHHCSKCGRDDVKLYRYYGGFLRDNEIYCGRHKPESNWIVPLVEDRDGTVWGYTSAPKDAVDRWKELPGK